MLRTRRPMPLHVGAGTAMLRASACLRLLSRFGCRGKLFQGYCRPPSPREPALAYGLRLAVIAPMPATGEHRTQQHSTEPDQNNPRALYTTQQQPREPANDPPPATKAVRQCGHLERQTTAEPHGHFMPDDAVEMVAKLRLFAFA